MTDYDFKMLNDKEFEVLCIDLAKKVEGHSFERFKPGKDGGVDGRYFTEQNGEVILQCKHWANTPINDLLRALRVNEVEKVRRLGPEKYILMISNPLSRREKHKIFEIFQPHIKKESDIFGQEDLNDILREHTDVERKHYKLWLHSAAVLSNVYNNAILGRSEFSLQEIHQNSARYVVTENHKFAIEQLEKLGVVIITGEPGVGKTTLAEHMCLHYLAQGFQFVQIVDDIREAEQVFDAESRQVFYFDDFLGRNYLEAVSGHEGAIITGFIRRVASNKNKRFVLTSRSSILNQGKLLIDSLENANIQKNEYALKISSLSEMDKAKILYNHVWHSNLSREHIDELYVGKRYREVVRHKNFNPRLISFITDSSRLDSVPPSEYWLYVSSSLSNPRQIWEHAFMGQQDDFCRAIIILVVLNRLTIKEEDLNAAYQRFIRMPGNTWMVGRKDFYSNTRVLTGSFLNRGISDLGLPAYGLFNPSVADYVLGRYGTDLAVLKAALICLRSTSSLVSLAMLEREKFISRSSMEELCIYILEALGKENFEKVSAGYLPWLCEMVYSRSDDDRARAVQPLSDATRFILDKEIDGSDDSFGCIKRGLELGTINSAEAMSFAIRNIPAVMSDDQISAAAALLGKIPDDVAELDGAWTELKGIAVERASEDVEEFVDLSSAFSEIHPEDYESATEAVEGLVADKLRDMGLYDVEDDASNIVGSFSVMRALDRFYENTREYEGEYHGRRTTTMPSSDADIDDLFDRGNT